MTPPATAQSGHARVHYAVGSLLAWWGWGQGAAQAFRDALRCQPSFDAYFRLGEELARTRCWPEASEAFREAARLRPSSVDAHGSLAYTLGRAGRWAAAAEAVQALIRLRPHHAELRLLLAAVMRKLHRPHDAIRSLRCAARLKPLPARVSCRLGEALIGGEGWRALVDAYRAARAVESAPSRARATSRVSTAARRAS